MTRLPIGSDSVGKDPKMGASIEKLFRATRIHKSVQAGIVAEKYQITRQDTDGFGLESQARAKTAIEEGYFDTQIIPVEAPVMDENFEKTGRP